MMYERMLCKNETPSQEDIKRFIGSDADQKLARFEAFLHGHMPSGAS